MTFKIHKNYAPGEKLYFRNGAGNDPSSKIQKLQAVIAKLLDGIEDEEKKKRLEQLQSDLDILEEDQIKLKEDANHELEERRKDEDESAEDDDPDVLKKNRDVDTAKTAAQRESDSQGRYSVLSYKIASRGVKGDSVMKLLGVRD